MGERVFCRETKSRSGEGERYAGIERLKIDRISIDMTEQREGRIRRGYGNDSCFGTPAHGPIYTL